MTSCPATLRSGPAVAHRPWAKPVGIAWYIRHADDPLTAEIAVTVVDTGPGRGLGTELIAHLAEWARHEGIRRFTVLLSADNVAALALLRNPDVGTCLAEHDDDTIELEITLAGYRCARCGTAASIDSSISSSIGSRGCDWICDACIRANVPLVEAKLDHLWWQ